MNVADAKRKVIALAQSHIGFHEGYNNYNPFAEDPELVKAYGWSPNNLAWCDIFTDYLFCKAFGATLGRQMTYQQSGMSAACKNSMACFRQNWAVFTTPQEGDIVFFYASGDVNHQGIVETVSGSSFTTIEGNTSDSVLRRTYRISDKTIAGFGRPDWELAVQEEDSDGSDDKTSDNTAETSDKTKDYSYLHMMYGDGLNAPEKRVEWLQQGLNLHSNETSLIIGIDGEFGRETELAVTAFRKVRNIGDSGETDEIFWRELSKFEI